MVSYTKNIVFPKNNNKKNAIKGLQYKRQNLIKLMPLTITYHGPSTTSRVW